MQTCVVRLDLLGGRARCPQGQSQHQWYLKSSRCIVFLCTQYMKRNWQQSEDCRYRFQWLNAKFQSRNCGREGTWPWVFFRDLRRAEGFEMGGMANEGPALISPELCLMGNLDPISPSPSVLSWSRAQALDRSTASLALVGSHSRQNHRVSLGVGSLGDRRCMQTIGQSTVKQTII